jgi:intein/homing endonuclease
MEKNNLTIWQKLSKTFGPNSLLNLDQPTVKLDKTVLLKTTDKQEYEKEKLEYQQSLFLSNQWQKIENNLYAQAVYYEPNRIAAFYDYESMEYCIAGDTKIATTDGFITIKELAEKGRDYEFITYAYDHNLKKVVPALARNAHYTRDEMTYKITFDDGSYIVTTWEHQLMKRDGSFERVMNLKEGDSMMPFYRKSFYNNEKYNWVYTCNSEEGHNGWVSEHNLIAEWFYGKKINKDEEVHHIDFNGKNNKPENLQIMNISEHRAYHARLNNEKLWTNPEYRQKMSEVAKRTGEHSWDGKRSGINNPAYFKIPFDSIIETAREIKTLKGTAKKLNVSYRKIQREIVNSGYKDWSTFLEAYGIKKSIYATVKSKGNTLVFNHKIVSIEENGVIPVYDLTVPGYKNFATDTIFSHNTPEISTALDIYSEESTTPNQDGYVLQIYSESKRIKSILTDLFNNVLDISINLPMWVRNTPIRENTMIPLLDGTEVSIKELSDRIKNGEEIWSYSIQDGTKAIVPSKIIWCDLTRKNSELYRVTLDDGTYIDTTPDHEYMLRDGSFKRADKLTKGESLMPFYTKKSEKKKDRIVGYEKVFNPSTGKYKFTHTMVSHECVRDLENEKIIGEQFDTHHIDFNKLNNHPKNLSRMRHSDHFKLHVEHFNKILGSPEVVKKRMDGIDRYLRSEKRRQRLSKEMTGVYNRYFENYNNSELHVKHNIIRSNKMLNHWRDNNFIEKTKKGMTIEINDTCLSYISNLIKNCETYVGVNELSKILKSDNEFIKLFKENYKLNKNITKSINPTTLKKVILRKTNKNYFDFISDIKPEIILDEKYIKAKSIFEGKTKVKVINHKVVSVIKLDETSDVYCLEAVGPNGEHDRHNFPVCGFDVNGNHSRETGVFLSNCKYGDNFVYLKLDPEKGVVGCLQLPNIEIERLERGMEARTMNSVLGPEVQFKNKNLKFVWKNKDMEFNTWEMAHFRLLGDDRKLPYGTSMLEKARRIWKQLVLAEDAMLIYRTSRAPERRVFKVFVGNMDDKDVEAYVQRVANKFKRDQVVDSKTGNVDLRFNQMAVDQDYFIPVRDPAATMPIETLPGAQNLSEIADIEYIQKKLVTALRIPKAFLGFEEPVGNGDNLSLLDIRFARTINKIQKSMIAELNKIAIIHLFLLGFEDELHNFTLGLTNPSKQADLLMVSVWKEKVLLYKDMVTEIANTLQPTSATWAKKHIFGFSDEEIKLEIQQIRLERAVAAELANTATVITKTGMFDNIDKLYKTVSGETVTAGGAPPPPPGGEGAPPPPPGGGEPMMDSVEKRNFNILLESNDLVEDEYIDLSKGRNSLGDIEKELDKLLNG